MAEKSSVVDRLSSLPNEILIDILSHLPIQFAIVTECLSSRWRGLWTNLTSIYVTNRRHETLSDFSAAFGDIVSQIKSPKIYNLTLRLILKCLLVVVSQPCDYSWLREICDRNLFTLKLTWAYCYGCRVIMPSFILQTSSLVSIELDTLNVWDLPDDGNSNPINLPNLRYLSVAFSNYDSLHKLIKSCPSLEELSLKCYFYKVGTRFNCSNPNLRRLTVNLCFDLEVEVVICAPKLEYLAMYSPMTTTLKFAEKSVGLRELKILGKGYLAEKLSLSKINDNWSIYNVRFLTLDAGAINKISTRFCRVTRVSLLMYTSLDIKSVLRLIELCPKLDVLYVECGMYMEEQNGFYTGCLRGLYMSNAGRRVRRKQELDFCKLLYYSETVFLAVRELEFKGVLLNMSREAGPKAWSRDTEEVIPFNDALPDEE